jgi:DNA (cytosine-5)-methyltransferase 1
MDVKVGSLFSGYGGLDIAVGGELAWFSDIEPSAVTIMNAHHPGVPNIGDVTQIDWKQVPRVDVLTGGYPCQPFSTAGYRKGTDDDRHLWPYVRDAISVLEPGLAVLENVAGHLSLGFGTVIGELSELGYAARWGVVRAHDAGLPHKRARVFIAAYPACAEWSETKSKYLPQTLFRQGMDVQLGERVSGSCFDWRQYAQAIGRGATITRRSAPEPSLVSNGKHRINPVFVEWMMGLPEGWVTNHGLSESEELKLLGNGVVPQQARLALELL